MRTTTKPNTDINLLHKQVVKRYHTLASKLALTDNDKKAIMGSYGVESSLELTTSKLTEVCETLQEMLNKKTGAARKVNELDRLRKGCIACLCRYIELRGIKTNDIVGYAKQIACRSAQRERFNQLTASELHGVIGYFNKLVKTWNKAEQVSLEQDMIDAFAGSVNAVERQIKSN